MSTPVTVKTQIQALINNANAKTGNNDTDLTTAVNSLIDGYGSGTSGDYLQYVNTVSFNDFNLFGKTKVELTFNNISALGSSFSQAKANQILEDITINVATKPTNVNAIFYARVTDTVLKKITFNIDISEAIYASSMFMNLRALEEIRGIPLNFSKAPSNASGQFNNCINLKEVRFAEGTIKNHSISFLDCQYLSDESIESIINGLADLTGLTAQTVTFHSDVKVKIEQNQLWLTAITNKNWTLA